MLGLESGNTAYTCIRDRLTMRYGLFFIHFTCNYFQADLEKQISKLEECCADRRWKLESAKEFHEYMRESAELEEWIGDQMQTASSEDYGQDYEHVQVEIAQSLLYPYLMQSERFILTGFKLGISD